MSGLEAEASAPASSANLGPGFDCLALALEFRCRVRARAADSWKVRHTGAHSPPEGSPDAVLMGAQAAAGVDHPLHLEVENLIPIGSGLGSSAAAYAAGMVAALRCTGRQVDPQEVFDMVSRLEGHPDNAAATVFGGLVLVDARGRVHRFSVSDSYGILVVVPTYRLYTRQSRQVVPQTFERGTVVRSLSRMAAVVSGLVSGEADLLRRARGDEIHEKSRNLLRPQVGEVIAKAMDAGAVYACWSGSGPSVLVVTRAEDIGRVADALQGDLGADVEIKPAEMAAQGIA